MYNKLICFSIVCLTVLTGIQSGNCPNNQFIKCCVNGRGACLGLGRGCGSLPTALWNGSCAGLGKNNSCHCMPCTSSGQCVSVCGHTRFACYNRYCQNSGSNNCNTSDGDQ